MVRRFSSVRESTLAAKHGSGGRSQEFGIRNSGIWEMRIPMQNFQDLLNSEIHLAHRASLAIAVSHFEGPRSSRESAVASICPRSGWEAVFRALRATGANCPNRQDSCSAARPRPCYRGRAAVERQGVQPAVFATKRDVDPRELQDGGEESSACTGVLSAVNFVCGPGYSEKKLLAARRTGGPPPRPLILQAFSSPTPLFGMGGRREFLARKKKHLQRH